MNQIFLLATQTAMAQQGISGESPTVMETQDTTVMTDMVAVEPPDAQTPETGEEAATEPQTPEATAIIVPTATPGIPDSIILKTGEFPYCIARRFNVNPNELIRINGLAGGGTYYEGMVIQLPQSDRTFPGSRQLLAHPTTYTVLEGDTIYKIACEFGDVSPEAIIFANNLVEPFTLTAGQVINIP
jgi:LysM repeat protein